MAVVCLPRFLCALHDDLGATLCVHLGTDLVDNVPVVASDVISFARITAFLGQEEITARLTLLMQPLHSISKMISQLEIFVLIDNICR